MSLILINKLLAPSKHRLGMAVFGALLAAQSPTWAYLGGFEDDDGYTNDYITGGGGPFGSGATNYFLNRYNAGNYGTANDGPGEGPAQIPLNSGLWTQLDENPLSGNRYLLAHALLGGFLPSGGTTMLGMRNQNSNVVAPLDIRYELDARDFDGLPPSLSDGSLVEWGVRVRADALTVSTADQAAAFYWTFRSASTNPGLQLGWNDSNKLIYRLPSESEWTVTSHVLDSTNYDKINLSMDLTNHRWSLSVSDHSQADLLSLIVDNVPMDVGMTNLYFIDWHMEANQAQTFFDESDFVISPVALPEPSTALLTLGLGFFGILRRKRSAV
jgi:hypothetical protein